jgi:biopolymer transport protein ExbB/TolQ
MNIEIRPAIRLTLLSGVFFMIFFSFIASLNNISSLSANKDSIQEMQNKQRLQKQDHLENITKNLKQEINQNSANETLLKVKPSEMKKLQTQNDTAERQPEHKNCNYKMNKVS